MPSRLLCSAGGGRAGEEASRDAAPLPSPAGMNHQLPQVPSGNRRAEKRAAKKQPVLEPKELARIGSARMPMMVFHEVPRAEGPKGQTSRNRGLRQPMATAAKNLRPLSRSPLSHPHQLDRETGLGAVRCRPGRRGGSVGPSL